MTRIIALFLVFVFAIPAAQAQSKKELAAQDAVLAERIARLEARMLTGDPAAEQLMQRMDALESEQRNLTGEVEQLRFERDKLKAEISALSEDLATLEALSDRMKLHLDAVDIVAQERASASYGSGYQTSPYGDTGSTTQPSMIPSPPTSREITVPNGSTPSEVLNGQAPTIITDDGELVAAGQQKLREGNFTGAQSDFETYLAISPDAVDAGEVSYWLGETYFIKGGYADAADAYINSMRKDPNGVKAPDALVRLAASLHALGETSKACEALQNFPLQFPNASAEAREKARVETVRTGC